MVSVALCQRWEWNIGRVMSHMGSKRAPAFTYGAAMARRAAEWGEMHSPSGRHALEVHGGRLLGERAWPVAAIAALLLQGHA